MSTRAKIPGRGVLYFLRGDKHAAVLVCSLASLRNHWHGPIHVLCGDAAAIATLHKICSDPRLGFGVTYKMFTGDEGKRGTGYSTKTLLPGLSPFDETLFLDADTLVVGSLDELWPRHPGETVLTQFADWVSNGRRISGRVAKWAWVAEHEVQRQLTEAHPAINTGVMAWTGDGGAFAQAWREMCQRNISFICDEIACQLVFPDFDVRVLDDRFNCSPIHSSKMRNDGARDSDVSVIHFHGGKHAKRDAGWAIWEPYYREACRLNLAGIRDWSPAGDKNLRERLARTIATA